MPFEQKAFWRNLLNIMAKIIKKLVEHNDAINKKHVEVPMVLTSQYNIWNETIFLNIYSSKTSLKQGFTFVN